MPILFVSASFVRNNFCSAKQLACYEGDMRRNVHAVNVKRPLFLSECSKNLRGLTAL